MNATVILAVIRAYFLDSGLHRNDDAGFFPSFAIQTTPTTPATLRTFMHGPAANTACPTPITPGC